MGLDSNYIHLLFTDCLNLAKNRVIQEFFNYGESYKIEFEITVDKLGTGWTNILHFTANATAPGDLGDGNRIPGVWMHSDSYFYIETFGLGITKTFSLNTK